MYNNWYQLKLTILILIGMNSVFTNVTPNPPTIIKKEPFNINGEPVTYPVGEVYYEGKKFDYIDFGNRSTSYGFDIHPSPIYILVTGFDKDGRPLLIEGQRVIFEHLPGEVDYSDLKRVNYLVVPESYQTNSHKDVRDIHTSLSSQTRVMATLYLNYPVVTKNSKIEHDRLKSSTGWYKGEEISYFDLGINPGNVTEVLQPIDVNSHQSIGLPITSTAPNLTSSYTAFWKLVPVPVPNSDTSHPQFTSISEVRPFLTHTINAASTSAYTILNRPLLPTLTNTTTTNNSTSSHKSPRTDSQGHPLPMDAKDSNANLVTSITLPLILSLTLTLTLSH